QAVGHTWCSGTSNGPVSHYGPMISSVVLAGCLAIAPSAPDVYAVVIGYNGAAEGLPQLQYADDDALRFALFFQGLAPKEHVWLLREWAEAPRQALKEVASLPRLLGSRPVPNFLGRCQSCARGFTSETAGTKRLCTSCMRVMALEAGFWSAR